jgi:hypothetical protein
MIIFKIGMEVWKDVDIAEEEGDLRPSNFPI